MPFEVEKVQKVANFDQKRAAKSPKSIQSKIRKKRPGRLCHSTFWQTFGKIHWRSSEILLLTDGRTTDGRTDDGRQPMAIGYRTFGSVNLKRRFDEGKDYFSTRRKTWATSWRTVLLNTPKCAARNIQKQETLLKRPKGSPVNFNKKVYIIGEVAKIIQAPC